MIASHRVFLGLLSLQRLIPVVSMGINNDEYRIG